MAEMVLRLDAEFPGGDDPLRSALVDMIRQRHAVTPRNLQQELGPSEVGHPCLRKLAYGMAGAVQCNPDYDPLPSIIGTATHTWLESAARHANEALGRTRWLTETRVTVADGLSGTADLYDCDTDTVIDYKCPGTTRFTRYRKDPGPVFRAQVMLYGRGFENAGYPVKRVAIALIPRAGTLHKLHLWQALYDPAQADAVLARRSAVLAMLGSFDVERYPDRFEWFPTTGYDCTYCPWWAPRGRGPLQCGGDDSDGNPPSGFRWKSQETIVIRGDTS